MRLASPEERSVTAFGSRDVTMRLVARTESAQVMVATYGPGGMLGRHPAVGWQVLHVVSGNGWVSGDDGVATELAPGQHVTWQPGEEHESGSAAGMVALIVETEAPPE